MVTAVKSGMLTPTGDTDLIKTGRVRKNVIQSKVKESVNNSTYENL